MPNTKLAITLLILSLSLLCFAQDESDLLEHEETLLEEPEPEIISSTPVRSPIAFDYATVINFKWELIALSGLIIYALNYRVGKSKNEKIIVGLQTQMDSLIRNNFAHIGFSAVNGADPLVAESAHEAKFYASGRANLDFLEISYQLRKREDLGYFYIWDLFFPEKDTIVFDLGVRSNIPIVLLVAQRTKSKTLIEANADINKMAGNFDVKNLHKNFTALCDSPQALEAALTNNIVKQINACPYIQSIHFSDQQLFSQSKGHLRIIVTLPRKDPLDMSAILTLAFSLIDNICTSVKLPHAVLEKAEAARVAFKSSKEKQAMEKHREALRKEKEDKLRMEQAWLKSLSPQKQKRESDKKARKQLGKMIRGKTMKVN